MGASKNKPTSPSRRYYDEYDFSNLDKKGPEKSLTAPKKSTAGRNHHGRITSRFRGGGHKQRYRII
ncbi:MAG: 50S ribosomal protein L2, partial [Myxococcales bacterium]|nr:50S ribosomal protein L2 [Myxococcales bacterium]